MSLEDKIAELTVAVLRNNELLEQRNAVSANIIESVKSAGDSTAVAAPKQEKTTKGVEEEEAPPTKRGRGRPPKAAAEEEELPPPKAKSNKKKVPTAEELSKAVGEFLQDLQPAVNDDDEPIDEDGDLLTKADIRKIDKRIESTRTQIKEGLEKLGVGKISELSEEDDLAAFAKWLGVWKSGETVDFDEE